MNHVYRIVWSASIGAFQVVSELTAANGAKSGGTGRKRRRVTPGISAIAAAAMLAAGSQGALAQVSPATVFVGGSLLAVGSTVEGVSWDGTTLSVPSGDTVTAALNGIQTSLGTVGTLINNGLITGTDGVVNIGVIGALNNESTISGSTTGVSNSYVAEPVGTVYGTIGVLNNNGLIIGGVSGVQNPGSIGTLSNSGTITTSTISSSLLPTGSTEVGVTNWGTIGTLTNSGTISSSLGVINGGTIDTLSNSGLISGAGLDGIMNYGTIGTLNNSGVVVGGQSGILNSAGIGVLTNSGTIKGAQTGIYSFGVIGTLTNTGTISGGADGIWNDVEAGTIGTIGTLINSNLISGGVGILDNGTINTLSNTGTISGSTAAISIGTNGTIGSFVNSGVIAGNIVNASANPLTIDGGTGSGFGTLTGYNGTVGTITSTISGANLTFGSGNLLLNDNINVGTNTVYNNSATLQVNGITTITGNYSQGEAATLLVGVSSGATATGNLTDTGYGRLVVNGDATIASGSSVELKGTTGGYAFAAGQRFVVVDATGTGTYNQSALNYSIAGYTSTLTGTSVTTGGHTDLVVTVDSATADSTTGTGTGTGTSTGTSGTGTTTPPEVTPTTPNSASAFNGLLSYTGVSNPGLLNLFNAATALEATGSAAQVTRAGAQLAPISQATVGQAASAQTSSVMNVVSGHLDSLRLAQNDGASGVSTGEGTLANGVWGQAFGGHASQSERDDIDGYSANFAGLMFGMDRAVSDAWRLGGVFSYSNGAINNTGDTAGDTTRVNSYGLTGYGGYTASSWYANVSAGAVTQRYNSTREIDFTGFSGQAGASFGGTQYVIRSEAGMPLAVGPMTVTPLAALTYSYQHQDSYTENGGNGAALTVGTSHATSVKSDMGAEFSREFSTSYGVLVPELSVAWRHEYDNTRVSTASSYAADPTGQTSFTTLGSSPVSNLADLALGVTLERANNLSLTARYEVQAGKGYVSQAGSLKLRQLF